MKCKNLIYLRIFNKFAVKNDQNEFILEQQKKLREVYEKEREEQISKDNTYHQDPFRFIRGFQEFNQPPVVSEDITKTEFYRPNPAAFQRKLDKDPYAVDVKFSSIDHPVYGDLDGDYRVGTQANSKYYTRDRRQGPDVSNQKPFINQLNYKTYEANEKGRQQAQFMGMHNQYKMNNAPQDPQETIYLKSQNLKGAGPAYQQPQPIFDSRGNLRAPGKPGQEYQNFKNSQMEMGTDYNGMGKVYNDLQNQEIIRYNIERLGGLESTVDSNFVIIL